MILHAVFLLRCAANVSSASCNYKLLQFQSIAPCLSVAETLRIGFVGSFYRGGRPC